ncbi:MAG: hypothetical protein VW708_08780 [Ilumatobacter sp.]
MTTVVVVVGAAVVAGAAEREAPSIEAQSGPEHRGRLERLE